MNERQQELLKFAVSYVMANLNDAIETVAINPPTLKELDELHTYLVRVERIENALENMDSSEVENMMEQIKKFSPPEFMQVDEIEKSSPDMSQFLDKKQQAWDKGVSAASNNEDCPYDFVEQELLFVTWHEGLKWGKTYTPEVLQRIEDASEW